MAGLGFTSSMLIPQNEAEKELLDRGFAGPSGLEAASPFLNPPDIPQFVPSNDQLDPISSAQFASETTPSEVASDRELSKRLGLNPEELYDATRQNFQRFDLEQRIDLGTMDTPTLRRMLQRDQELTALSSGSISQLVASERAARELSFTGAFSNGVDLLQGLGWRFVETVGEAVGSEELEAFAQEAAESNMAEAAAGGVKQRFLDIQDAGDFFTWMKHMAGEQIPLMAPSVVGGLAGAKIGALTGTAGGVFAPVTIPVGTAIGAVLGAFIPSFILGVGETQNAIKERDINVENPGAAFGSGFLIGLLDSALPGTLGTITLKAFGREGAEKMFQKAAVKIMARNAVIKGGQGLALEGITEAIQEAISETTAASVTGQEIDQAALLDQMIEAFAAGAFLGFGTRGGVSVGSDIINNRRFDNAMNAMSDAAKNSELKILAPDKAAEVHAEQMRAAGVERVFVPVDVILQYAQNQPESTPEVLKRLGVTEALEAGGKVEIALESYSMELLGAEGFKQIGKHLSATADGTSIAESVATVFSNAQAEAELSDQLETFDASDQLKEQVQDTITKAAADPANASDILSDAGSKVEAIMDALIKGVEDRQVSTAADEQAGRIALLDDEIAAIDQTIDTLDTERDARVEAGQPTTRIDGQIAKEVEARNAKLDEQFQINVPAEAAPVDEGAQADLDAAAAAELADKPIKIKARKLQKLAVKVTKEGIRSAREGFKAGIKAGKTLKAAQKEIKKVLTAATKGTAMTKAQLAKLKERIDNTTTLAQLTQVTEAVQSRAAVLMETQRKKQIKAAIKKTLKKNKPKVLSGKLIGTEADVEAILARARKIIGTPPTAAKETLEQMQSRDIYADDYVDPFEQQLMAIAANSKDITSDNAADVLLELDAIIEEGKASAANRLMKRQAAVQRDQEEGLEATLQGEPLGDMTTTGFLARLKAKAQDVRTSLSTMHNGWDEVLDITFNKAGVQAERLIESLRLTKFVQKFKGRAMQWEQRLQELSFEALQVDSYSKLMDRHREDSVVHDFGKRENVVAEKARKDFEAKKITKAERDRIIKHNSPRVAYSTAQIRKLWMERQDPTIRDIVQDPNGNALTDATMRLMFLGDGQYDGLQQSDYDYANAQLKFYKEMYADINRTYRRIYGIDLPFNEFYSPIRRTKASRKPGDDTFGAENIIADEMTFRRNLPKALKNREDSISALKQTSDVGAMHRYMHDMAWFTETAEQVVHMKNVFKSQSLRAAIEENHGQSMTRFIDEFLEDFGSGYPNRGVVAEEQINFINRQFSGSILALKGTIGTKQLVSWFAMADGIPTAEFMASHADFFKGPARTKEIMKILWDVSPSLRERGSSLDFELAKIGSDREPVVRWKHGQKLQDVFFSMIKTGDRIPIYAGGWAVYQHTLKKTGSKKKAGEAFEDAMNSTQQSTDIDKMSGLQRSGAIGRTLTMFMTARMALLRGELRAFRQRPEALGGTGKLSYREFGKRIATYHFIMPMMIQFIASGFKWDDDRQLIAGLLGQLNTFVIFGDILNTAITEIVAEDPKHWRGDNDMPLQALTKELWEGARSAFDEDLRADDMLEVFVEMAGALGNFAGQPVDQVANIMGGVGDVVDGDIGKGLKRIWGFSEKVAEESSQ